MYETELLEEIIIKYESYEEIFADDVFSEIQESDHRYNSLSQEERIKLKRDFSKYLCDDEEKHSFIEQRKNTTSETDFLIPVQSNSCFGHNALLQNRRRPHIKYALLMAKYIDFGFDIGSGASFRLEQYYRMCDEITGALREHESLLEKHFNMLTDKCYVDDSLHLMTFDLIYCCKTYDFYQGLVAPSTGKTVRKRKTASSTSLTPEEIQEKERKRQEEIQAL